MDQRISLITLGVADLRRAHEFYTAIGWQVGNDWRAQKVAFFQCGGMVLALWDRNELAADSGTQPTPPGAVTLAHNVRNASEVDATLAEAERAGATIVRRGAQTSWGGYSAAFLDPDGHAWEIAHNPSWTIAMDGSVEIR